MDLTLNTTRVIISSAPTQAMHNVKSVQLLSKTPRHLKPNHPSKLVLLDKPTRLALTGLHTPVGLGLADYGKVYCSFNLLLNTLPNLYCLSSDNPIFCLLASHLVLAQAGGQYDL
jgi:hypothetical protein